MRLDVFMQHLSQLILLSWHHPVVDVRLTSFFVSQFVKFTRQFHLLLRFDVGPESIVLSSEQLTKFAC